ncbi:MAG: hypothetical protein V1863_06920 [Candidatus Omnitrophota bacterium]
MFIHYIRVIYTLTDCDQNFSGCGKGVIDEKMIQAEIPDCAERMFYVCGPPGMVLAMKTLLTERLNLPAGKIITEEFIGY